VLIPKSEYKPQKPKRAVRTSIPAKTSKIMPMVPVITFVKNSTAIKAAIRNLITLSILPTFFFITLDIYFKIESIIFIPLNNQASFRFIFKKI